MTSGVFDDEQPQGVEQFEGELDAGFRFALNCSLDGVAGLISSRERTEHPTPGPLANWSMRL